MARAPNDNSFDPLPTKNISTVVKLTHSWLMHLNINCLSFCNPGNVKGYSINLFRATAPDDHSFKPLHIKIIFKVIKLTSAWPEQLIHLTL